MALLPRTLRARGAEPGAPSQRGRLHALFLQVHRPLMFHTRNMARHMQTQRRRHMHTETHTHTHAHTYAYTHLQAHTHMLTHALTHRHTWTHTGTHVFTQTYMHVLTHKARAHRHTLTHTCSHARALPLTPILDFRRQVSSQRDRLLRAQVQRTGCEGSRPACSQRLTLGPLLDPLALVTTRQASGSRRLRKGGRKGGGLRRPGASFQPDVVIQRVKQGGLAHCTSGGPMIQ